MRSVKARFNRFNKEPLSSYIAFSKAVKNQNFSRDSISRNFINLVDPDDYCCDEKKSLIDYLYDLSNPTEEHVFSKGLSDKPYSSTTENDLRT